MSYSVEDMCAAGRTTRRGVRYWEDQNLLGEVARSEGNQRQYTDEQIDRAKIIAAAQFSGMTLAQIGEVVAVYDVAAMNEIMARLARQAKLAADLINDLPIPPVPSEYDL